MDLVFSLTPGLHIFLPKDLSGVSMASETSTFYSVTLLTLLGHFPGAFLMGLWVRRSGHSTENAVLCSALWWVVVGVLGIALLLVHAAVRLPFVLHALVVTALVTGTLVRVLTVVSLPVSYWNGHTDGLLVILWWFFMAGIDWPEYPVQSALLVELAATMVATQMVQPAHGGAPAAGGAATVALTPILLRWTRASQVGLALWTLPVLIVCWLVSVLRSGCGMDVNRLMDWGSGRDVDPHDLEKGS